jgi:amino acid transporter
VFAVLAFTHDSATPHAPATGDFLGGVLVAMWNTMGWDNAGTIAGEVERPQRTYPLAMLLALGLVILGYVVPIASAWAAGTSLDELSNGGWADAAGHVGGRALSTAVVAGGMVSAVGMLSSLLLSYSRVPMVLAEDGYLPRVLAARSPRGVPVGALLLYGVLVSASLAVTFDRLVLLDILLYGLSLVLEFVALVVLRVREPELRRPFRIPLGVAGCVALAAGPTLLLLTSLWKNMDERIWGVRSIWLAATVIALGPLVYAIVRSFARRRASEP